jgi:hypothetical protein
MTLYMLEVKVTEGGNDEKKRLARNHLAMAEHILSQKVENLKSCCMNSTESFPLSKASSNMPTAK